VGADFTDKKSWRQARCLDWTSRRQKRQKIQFKRAKALSMCLASQQFFPKGLSKSQLLLEALHNNRQHFEMTEINTVPLLLLPPRLTSHVAISQATECLVQFLNSLWLDFPRARDRVLESLNYVNISHVLTASEP